MLVRISVCGSYRSLETLRNYIIAPALLSQRRYCFGNIFGNRVCTLVDSSYLVLWCIPASGADDDIIYDLPLYKASSSSGQCSENPNTSR